MKTRSTQTDKARRARPSGKRVENKEKTKQAILRAALVLFSSKGFHATTTRAISKKAGIAEGTLFNYFRTKEDLALYFFEEETDKLMGWYERNAAVRKAPLPEKLFALIHQHLEQIAPHEDFIGAIYLRALEPASKLSPLSFERRELNLRYLKFVREILDQAAEAGEIPQVGQAGAFVFGLFHVAMLTHWLHDQSPGKEKTLALLDRCLRGASLFLQKGRWEW